MLQKLQQLCSIAILIFAQAIALNAVAQNNASEKLMLFSDLHYLSPSLMTSGGTNLQKAIDADNKMFDRSSEILDAIISKALANKPAGVLIPGDLTKEGEKYSHNEIATKLQQLVDAGIKVWVIPGNHDVNNPNAKSYTGGMVRTVSSPTSAEFATIYANMGYNDAIERDKNSLSYVCEPLPGLWLIAVDDTKAKQRDKDKTLVANGIPAATLTWILAKADEAKEKGKQVMVMMHHQIIPHVDDQDALIGDAMVADVENVRSQMLEHDLHLFLTGHVHISDAATWYTAGKANYITEVSTGSAIAYPCHVRNISMNESRDAISFTTDRITKTATDSNFAASALARAKSGTKATVSSIVYNNWEEVSGMLSDYGATLSQEDFTEAVYAGLGNTFSKLTIAMSEGNEPQSGVTPSQISKEIDSGSDKTVETLLAGQNFLVIIMAKAVVKGRFHDLFDEAMNSALLDKTGIGTALADVTDDLTPTVKLPAPKQVGIKGDVNNDGTVDIADVNAVINKILGLSDSGSCDVNGDGAVDIADVNQVINIILGL